MNENNATEETLKAIHAEQQKQTKLIKNIYHFQALLFALAFIALVVGLALSTGKIKIDF